MHFYTQTCIYLILAWTHVFIGVAAAALICITFDFVMLYVLSGETLLSL